NGDQVGEFRADRRQQHLYASRPIHHDLTDEIGVHVVDVLLLNKSDAHSEFNKESVEANLRFPIAGQIPNDPKLVINSINRGNPFVTTHPESEISQRIRELVGKLMPAPAAAPAPEAAEKKARKGLFARR